uniref:(northern house mosquito) hypothetical protein n=1 Tax=Culex pipiens TaxID=7175 RepID=A0A8D8F173_CULPI
MIRRVVTGPFRTTVKAQHTVYQGEFARRWSSSRRRRQCVTWTGLTGVVVWEGTVEVVEVFRNAGEITSCYCFGRFPDVDGVLSNLESVVLAGIVAIATTDRVTFV